MKRTGVLNAELARVIAAMGHGDRIVVADAGLPVPPGVACIDLAVTLGVPRFDAVLQAILSEMVVEQGLIAQEAGAEVRGWVSALAPQEVSHEVFKRQSAEAVAIIRTGEATPYANIALIAGVAF